MRADFQKKKFYTVIGLDGRFDAVGAHELDNTLDLYIDSSVYLVVVDFSRVTYISSAGLRILLKLARRLKQKNGETILAGVNDYCMQVLELTGFGEHFRQFKTVDEAEGYCLNLIKDGVARKNWDELANAIWSCGNVKIVARAPGAVSELVSAGRLANVLSAGITPGGLHRVNADMADYVVGYGGMGPDSESCYPLIGNILKINNALAWQPTDGQTMPDFLMSPTQKGDLPFYSAYDVSIRGEANATLFFEAKSFAGVSLPQLGKELARFARDRMQNEFKGALGVAMIAQVPVMTGVSLKKAPLEKQENRPEGATIRQAGHYQQWYTGESSSQNSTAIIVGTLLDAELSLQTYDIQALNQLCRNKLPASPLHQEQIEFANTAAVGFARTEFSAKPVDLKQEMEVVCRQGELASVVELIPEKTAIYKALISLYCFSSITAEANEDESQPTSKEQPENEPQVEAGASVIPQSKPASVVATSKPKSLLKKAYKRS